MRWTQVNNCWECVFANVPFKVRVWQNGTAHLFFLFGTNQFLIHSFQYPSIEEAKADVNNFILNYLALYSAQVHRECLEANVMTWRKLKEQLDQIPENQLDEAINHLDTDGYWIGEPRIELATEDMYMEEDLRDCTRDNLTYIELVVEKGKYFLSTCNI